MKRKKKSPSRPPKRILKSSSKRPSTETLVSLAAVARQREQAYRRDLSDIFRRLEVVDAELAQKTVETLGARDKAAIWLNAPQLGLGGQSPLQVAAEGRRDDVLRVLGAIEHGFSV